MFHVKHHLSEIERTDGEKIDLISWPSPAAAPENTSLPNLGLVAAPKNVSRETLLYASRLPGCAPTQADKAHPNNNPTFTRSALITASALLVLHPKTTHKVVRPRRVLVPFRGADTCQSVRSIVSDFRLTNCPASPPDQEALPIKLLTKMS